MSQRPFLSVIIPCFRSAKTLPHLLESLSQQSFRDFEVLVMDGGSDDATIQVAEKWRDSLPALKIQSEKDEGIYDAINKGIQTSKGEWIYVIGSDDRIFSADVFALFHSHVNGRSERLVYGNVEIKGDAGWAKDGQIYDGEFDRAKIISSNICQQAVFYHRNLFDRYGLFEKRYSVCADWDFLFRVIAREKIHYLGFTIAHFYGGGTSVNRQDLLFQEELPENLYRYFGRDLRSSDFYPLRYRILDLAGHFHARGKRLKAWRCQRIFSHLQSLSPTKDK